MAGRVCVGVDPNRRDDLSKALSDLESQIAGSMKTLVEAELKDLAQVGIVRELLSGNRTSSEIVDALYGVRRGDEGFQSHYTKIRREIADLESKGFVSRRLFGRDRPYRLTQLAVARLTRMANVGPTWSTSLVPRLDLFVYGAAVCLAGICALGSMDILSLPPGPSFLVLLSTALFLGGIAFTRFVETLRRVV